MQGLKQTTVATNIEWFNENVHYMESQANLECYQNIQKIVERALALRGATTKVAKTSSTTKVTKATKGSTTKASTTKGTKNTKSAKASKPARSAAKATATKRTKKSLAAS